MNALFNWKRLPHAGLPNALYEVLPRKTHKNLSIGAADSNQLKHVQAYPTVRFPNLCFWSVMMQAVKEIGNKFLLLTPSGQAHDHAERCYWSGDYPVS